MAQPAAQRIVSEARLGTLQWTSIKAQPYGATGDGTTDDTAAFVAAIASSSKTIFVPDGIYIVNGLVMNVANQTMFLSPGATLRAKAGGNQVVVEMSAAGTSLVGLGFNSTIDGNSVGNSAGSTLYAHASNQLIQGLTVINPAGIGINVAGGDYATIDSNTITNSGNTGIFLSNSPGTSNLLSPTVSNNRITNTGNGYGISAHVIAGGGVILRPRFIDNDVILPGTATAGLGIELFGGNSFGSVIGNTVEGGTIGISIDKGPSVTVSGNSVHGSFLYGIELAGATMSTVTGNSIDGNNVSSNGISVSNVGAGMNSVVGNTIANIVSGGYGIHAQDTTSFMSTIQGNSVTATIPIYMAGGFSGHTITGNSVNAGPSAVCGIFLDNTTSSIVANNTCNGFSTAGVNAFNGTMNGLIIGPNVMLGGTPAEFVNGWTPGTSGTGSRVIRGNIAPPTPSTPTVTASPYTYTNTSFYPQTVYVRGGTVSSITRGGVQVGGATEAAVPLESGQSAVITYSSAPTVVVDTK